MSKRTRNILIVVGLLFSLWVIGEPSGAAEMVRNLFSKLEDAANAIIQFLKGVING